MEKYIIGLFVFVALVAVTGLFTDAFPSGGNNIQGALIAMNGRPAMQKGASVLVGKTGIQKDGPKSVSSKTAQTGLIIQNGIGYTQTPMQGMVMVKGLSISVNTLKEKGITLLNGKLITPRGKDVQIRDVELRRKPVKLSMHR